MSQQPRVDPFDRTVDLSGCVLDSQKKILWVKGSVSSLPRKAVELLCFLSERAGSVVTKEEIWGAVWEGVFVEETNLTHNIYLLRRLFRTLGQDKVIETVPRVGYRFIGRLAAPGSGQSTAMPDPVVSGTATFWTASRWRTALVSILLTLLLLAVGTAYYAYRSATRRVPKASIAILPLKTIGQGSDAAYNAAGLTDLLVTRLGNMRNLTVVPVGLSTDPALDLAAPPADLGRQLHVDAVLDWSIYRNERQVRVTLRLVDAANGSQLWGGQLERPLESEFALQNDIAELLATALSIDLSDQEKFRISQNITTDADAYQLYLKARVEWNKRNFAGLAEAQNLFRNAIKKDPNFALAYVGLADSLIFGEDVPELDAAIDRALELDPEMGEGYASRGFHRMVHLWDWKGAEEDLRKAIALNPRYSTAHQWLAVLLSVERRLDEAEAEMGRALDLNPGSYNFIAGLGQIYYFKGDLAKAEEYCRRSLEINPDFIFAHEYLADILYARADYEGAHDEAVRAAIIRNTTSSGGVPGPSRVENADKELLRRSGLKMYLQRRLRRVEDAGDGGRPEYSLDLAIRHARLGQWEETLHDLEMALKRRPFILPWINVNPLYKPIRGDKRFAEIVQKIGIPQF